MDSYTENGCGVESGGEQVALETVASKTDNLQLSIVWKLRILVKLP